MINRMSRDSYTFYFYRKEKKSKKMTFWDLWDAMWWDGIGILGLSLELSVCLCRILGFYSVGFQNFVRKPTNQTARNSYPIYVSIQLVQYYLQQPAGYLQPQIQVPSTCHKNPSAPPKIIKPVVPTQIKQ